MPRNISTTQRLAPGQTWTITDLIGINFVAPAAGHSTASFSNAGTILVNTDSPYISAGINYDYGSETWHSVFTNEATGVFRMVSTGGVNATYGFTAAQGFGGFNGDFVNHGIFEVKASAFAAGVMTADGRFDFTNTGTFRIEGATGAIGISAMNGGVFRNSGLIEAVGPLAIGFQTDRPTEITNSGTIRAIANGAGGLSIGISISHGEGTVGRITNSGRIDAQYAILDETNYSPPQRSEQEVINTGEIVGVIDLARGDDRLVNSGSIDGEIWLGYGADLYEGAGGAHVGAIHGSFGNDVLTGGSGGDVLFGEDGDDVIRAGEGDDFLQGGRGSDVLDGGAGVDTLIYESMTMGVDLNLGTGVANAAGRSQISGVENVYGSRWADTLRGDSGRNTLFGGDGDDILDGGGAADILAGGRGADVLTGGKGNDTFRFGVGDGADQITDLAAGDRVIIHGYAAWREIVQVGADTRIVLSDTDSLLLRHITPAEASGLISFTSDPRPAYVAPGETPEMLGEVHVEIRDRFVIHEGEVARFNGSVGGLAVYGEISEDAGVTNGGRIVSTGSTSNGAIGIGLSGFNHAGAFENLASGVLRVTTSHADGQAIGVIGNGFGARVLNHGLIDVRGADWAFGVQGLNMGFSLANTGVMRVESGGAARGADVGDAGDLVNHGLIDVTGSGDVIGVEGRYHSNIVNHGTLRVHDRTGDGIGIQLRSDHFSIVNTGLIDADVAIDARGSSPFGGAGSLENSGEIRGRISLSGWADEVVNTGLIQDDVHLNEGNDLYDGSAGRQAGDVIGGWGQDRLIGGAASDRLFGGEQSDTLSGGLGDDYLDGGAGDDFVVFAGPRSAYSWTADGDTLTVTGPEGVDVLTNVELLRFSDQLVSLTGFGVRERGSSNDDVLVGTELDDTLDGGPVPHLWESQGSTDNGQDQLFGLGGNDTLTGGGRNDLLDGGVGHDRLEGGDWHDILIGGSGDDVLLGGARDDYLHGGQGFDTVVLPYARDAYEIVFSQGRIRITGPDGTSPYSGEPIIGVDVLTSIERLQFSDQTIALRTLLSSGSAADDVVVGLDGDDLIEGGAGADQMFGGGGDDDLAGGAGNDILDGGAGYDVVTVDGVLADYVLLRSGEDFILKGAEGSDRLIDVEGVRFRDGGFLDLARQVEPGVPSPSGGLPPLKPPADADVPQVFPGAPWLGPDFMIPPSWLALLEAHEMERRAPQDDLSFRLCGDGALSLPGHPDWF